MPYDGPPLRWLPRGERALPATAAWLAPYEAARAGSMRHPKRRTEYLLRRLVAKHAVALALGRSLEPAALARTEVRNEPSGAPYLLVDGAPAGLRLSLTDRAGWAVCLLGDGVGGEPFGCDLELVEPRSPAFVRDYLTGAERRYVAGCRPGEAQDAAATLVWSAKESALKALRVGLAIDPRTVEVRLGPPAARAARGWSPLSVRAGATLPGWWRRDGRFLLTVVAGRSTDPAEPPCALADGAALSAAEPRHSWLDRPGPSAPAG
jgi:4'-phosphopantetheinyl transferase